MLVHFCGATVAAAFGFAALIFIFGAPHARESLAVTAATIIVALGVLFTGHLYWRWLNAAGAKPWVAAFVLAVFVLSPTVFVVVMPRWGPVALALSLLTVIWMAREREVPGHAR
ncbi:hypothetical protein [Polaromonas aquatica]|uniref:hypothetical protein n=1 Tax=Polaromonas aquatica TaxID=332657 RepID=UPI003D65C5A8